MRRAYSIVVVVGASGLLSPAFADARLPALFSNGMVLQQGATVPVWGWADPLEAIVVQLGSQTRRTIASPGGEWRVDFSPLRASNEPVRFQVRANNTIELSDVVVGVVWVCSGQSNMQWSVSQSADSGRFVREANDPLLRMFTVTRTAASSPQKDCKGAWRAASPRTVPEFSAVGYHFARNLRKELGVPVGMIHTSWGGTPAEAWTREEYLAREPALSPLLARKGEPNSPGPNQPSTLYNGMIAPLIPYRIEGAIWYQGESNVGRAQEYRTLFPTMIRNWRADWRQGDFPFYFVQIAPFRYGGSDPTRAAELRDAQLYALRTVRNTGMVVTMDIGDPTDIHPANKHEVGRRLALWALANTYGRAVAFSGPIAKSATLRGNEVVVRFDFVGGGLKLRSGDAPTHFEVAGPDGEFHEAHARILGSEVIVSASVPDPKQVRYGWRDDAEPNLTNDAGLPASPFRLQVSR